MENRNVCLEELRRRIAGMQHTQRGACRTAISSSCEELNSLLPDGGFRRGALVEWISSNDGVGACTLAMLAAREACHGGGMLAVVDRRGEFCPPAAVRLGIALEQLMVVRTNSEADHNWAMDQVLRSPVVAATLAWPDRLDGHTFRRWQLAVEEGGGLGLLVRSASARNEPSWADVRLWVEPQPNPTWQSRMTMPTASRTRHLRMVLLRCRGGVDGRSLDVEFDDETYRVYSSAERRLQVAT